MEARRFALYFSWSRSKETAADLGTLEGRFPALFEFRRAIWPHYEHARAPVRFHQGMAGFLEHVILSDFQGFRSVIAEVTGHRPPVIDREADGVLQPLDDALLNQIGTLIVVSFDHFDTGQRITPAESEAVQRFLRREKTCLIVCPHHDIGAGETLDERLVEFTHHGDPLVPAQQRIGGFAQAPLVALGWPITNRYGLSPARASDGSPAPLESLPAADDLKVLQGVGTFNTHPHLPHLFVPSALSGQVRILAWQLINPLAARHPFVDAGNRYFNALLWIPPDATRAGHVFVCDGTL